MEKSLVQPTLHELIERGCIQTPASLVGEAHGTQVEAMLQPDGSLLAGADVYNSLSVAVGMLITSKTGRKAPGRSYYACNGWKFWRIATADGSQRTLAEIRQEAGAVS